MKRQHSEKGAALVELAIVMPVLLLILTAIAEYGLLFRTFEITTNAVREGARLAALPGNEENDYAVVRARVESYLADAQLPGSRTIAVAPEAIAIGGLSANGVSVSVTYTYDTVFLGLAASLINGSFADSVTYQSAALMRVQVAAVGP
jgi:Flp pilus assembly protein TadG